MKAIRFIFFIFLISVVFTGLRAQTDTLRYGPFGKITIYKPSQAPTSMVLFVSGDGGWMLGVVDMARALVREGALVAGIDIRKYYHSLRNRNGSCYYPASDFENLSMFLQKRYKFPEYLKPVLFGYSSGATLVYGILRQAPANTFKGVVSLGFCPDIEIDRPLCTGNGLKWHTLKPGKSFYLEKEGKLNAPFIVLQGMNDHVCSCNEATDYIKGMNEAEIIPLPRVGHGFAVEANWLSQMQASLKKILVASSFAEQRNGFNKTTAAAGEGSGPDELPVIPIPASGKDTQPLALMISGDGGWTNFDQELALNLAEKGIPIVGVDAQKYFWNERSPVETSSAVNRILEQYMTKWNRKTFILVGYSFGANVVPFIANRLPASLESALRGLYLLSPDLTADFEIHVADMLSLGISKEKYDVLKETERITRIQPVCIFGAEEESLIRDTFGKSTCKLLVLPGSHHFNDDFQKLTESICSNMPQK
jgi:type IV secretory pathway VirJ component